MIQVVIIGAGPAGLTAAYELSKNSDYHVTVVEESDTVGGISRTVNYKGNRMDMGGHRFFSKVEDVNRWWADFLPNQGKPAFDDIALGRDVIFDPAGPDPEKANNVMLCRDRLSRIYFNKKFFSYPISLQWETIKNMGLGTTFVAGMSYVKSCVSKLPETNLENFYINRFGKKLYSMFFEHYTENLWGRHPSEISAEWGAQRVKGLSIRAILKDIATKMVGRKTNENTETSLIEAFKYPKYGPGQLWEAVAEQSAKNGVNFMFMKKAETVLTEDKDGQRKVCGVVVQSTGASGDEVPSKETLRADIVISSMPLRDLVVNMDDAPEDVFEVANGLPYRDYVTVGVLFEKMALKKQSGRKTLGEYIPDNWVYVHDRDVKMGRFQVYNNWSPYMVAKPDKHCWVGLEYFCNEGDEFWSKTDTEIAEMAIEEMRKIGILGQDAEVLDFHTERVRKAYPAYFDTYTDIQKVRDYVDSIRGLYCVGRNGQHRYNNMDHSMCTAFEAVKNIVSGATDNSNIWNVNTEKEYHESNSSVTPRINPGACGTEGL